MRDALLDRQEQLKVVYRIVRARVEYTLARMKVWKILRDYRRTRRTLADTASVMGATSRIWSFADAMARG